jgi:transcriptional regulator with AAA-type ATPase domain
MPLIPATERTRIEAIAQLVYCNPFLGERITLERHILGDAFVPTDSVWHPLGDVEAANRHLAPIGERAERLAGELRSRLLEGVDTTPADIELYQDLCIYVLYNRCRAGLLAMLRRPSGARGRRKAPFFDEFQASCGHLLDDTGVGLGHGQTEATLFACFSQVRRAFEHTFYWIVGGSLPAARLRAQVWQSIFTHDLRRYQRALYSRMGEVTTLITGPSGAGKELVARAIGLARYIPFDPETRSFEADPETTFLPLNLSALSPTLVESELFGHRRGAFTGAVADRRGWLELCPPTGTVFLDEIGEIDANLQVKLLRVLESRTFQPLGTTDDRRFAGKVVAATNRDLGREMQEGRFREDLYYRLCSDTVVAPSLRERIADRPEELDTLIHFLAQRLVGEEEAPGLTDEAASWIRDNLGEDYPWPGNVRELSHCVSNVMIHADYRPAERPPEASPAEQFAAAVAAGELPLSEVVRRYCTLVHEQAGSYVEAARRLGVDRRTVRTHTRTHTRTGSN